MAVTVESMPGCCTSKVLVNFGHSSTSRYGRSTPSKNTLATEILDKMKLYGSNGFLQAITTTEQQIPNEVLAELGWTKHLESKKLAHSENQLCLWTWQPLDQTTGRKATVPENPFAAPVAAPAPVTRPIPEGYAQRMLHDYVRPPKGIWIAADGSRPCPASIEDLDVGTRITSANTRSPDWGRRPGCEWVWEIPEGVGKITAVYIHP